LSVDHKPSDPKELQRIQQAGATVNEEGRINGNLNLSRAIGDLTYKHNDKLSPKDQAITAFPDVTFNPVSQKTDFIVMGCDGIWESHNNQQVVEKIYDSLYRKVRLAKVCDSWLD
jgi:serine/threonine protein phosphatase PrpC